MIKIASAMISYVNIIVVVTLWIAKAQNYHNHNKLEA